METTKDIVSQFSKYCAKCNGQCCKKDVFTVFDWEMEQLSANYKDFHVGKVTEQRGTSKDISICGKCMFSEKNGCVLPVKLRPTDCLTYPFYPKLKENSGAMKIDSFVVHTDCPFHEAIAEDEKLVRSVQKYWDKVVVKVNSNEVVDWIGKNGSWREWYSNTIAVNGTGRNTDSSPDGN